MKIGGFQRLTLLDYPGQVACIVFTKGCNFRCPFCHNAGLVLEQDGADELAEAMVLSYLEKRKSILDGVVITGGEPLMWSDLPVFLRKVRKLGYQIKLDTNGSFPKHLKSLLDERLIDYVAMDIKQTKERYSFASGVDMDKVFPLVEECLHILEASKIPFELRTTVVKGLHSLEDMTAIAKWIDNRVPYYLQSYVNSGHIISPDSLSEFSEEELEEIISVVRQYCPSAALRK